MGGLLFWWRQQIGLEEGGLATGKAKKCPVDTFLARGRVHGAADAAVAAVDDDP